METSALWSFPYATRPIVLIESGFNFFGIKVADFSNRSNGIITSFVAFDDTGSMADAAKK